MLDYRNREKAYALLREYTENKGLIKHALAVEASMRAYAKYYGEDEDEWGVVGLLHDFDYERYPSVEEHTVVGGAILRDLGYPEHVIEAIAGHADRTGERRKTRLDHALFACDEISGFVTAVALVRPTKSVMDVDVASVKKKLKDKAFAKGVSREDVYQGAEELGRSLDEHIEFVIRALQAAADELELRGVSV
ncbi:HAD family hydrolase [Ferroacidibacillus organovorans]|uniref:HAD family hydrolase n=1 Tax=Ferroacidibacillus organovorans TaxID=1765683 RepID=A0A117SYL4_9BACL|nr:HAD family hydrolase [Ferroacidibacillus organovorans]